MEQQVQTPSGSGKTMAIIGLVVGIVGLILAVIPCTFWAGYIMGAAGLVLAILGLNASKKVQEPVGMAKAGMIVSIIAIVVALLYQFVVIPMFINKVEEAGLDLQKLSQEIEKNNASLQQAAEAAQDASEQVSDSVNQ